MRGHAHLPGGAAESPSPGRRSGNVAPKRLFEDQLFGLSGDVGSNAVEVYVHRLRKMLGDSGASVKIHTVRGVGYLMAEEKAG